MKFNLSILIIAFIGFPCFSQILDKTELKSYSGFFDFYYETATDRLYLKVKTLNEEFLYVNSLASGVGSNDIGLDRGQLGNTRIVYFKKAGNKLLLIEPNQDYRANTDNILEQKSVKQAFAESVIFGFEILSFSNSEFIIDFTPFLLQDMHGVTNRLKVRGEGVYKLEKSRSALWLDNTKAFPSNVEFEAFLTFTGEPKGKHLRTVVPSVNSVSVVQHHSFIKLPDEGYQPREFDPRSGALFISYLDYASPIQEAIKKRLIIRHRLEKKNPNKVQSEAKDPIIYYLDAGTPEPVRSALLDGARWWNQAFQAIGFKDAFQVKMLPPDVDPMDCRYNVIQWVHRSTRGWSYGASVVDPRTGEIIKGHVSLGSLRVRQDFLIAQALMNKPFANSDKNYEPMLEMALARIRQLSAHEVGHTLGFAHNFAASSNKRASVMDYPHPKITVNNGAIDFNEAYDTQIGDWDKVTVAYSYSEFETNINEIDTLRGILENAQKQGLRFITDYDARATGGAHVTAHLWDNGATPSDELENVLKVRAVAIANFSEDNIKKYEPYSVLEDVFVPLYFYHRYQVEAASKVIGGLDYNYAIKGDNQFTVKPVTPKTQQNTLKIIMKTLTPEVLAVPIEKLKLFPPRAYGYGRLRESFLSKTGVAFDPLSTANTASDMTLKYVLHPQRANRLVLQHVIDDKQLSLEDVLLSIISSTVKKSFKDDYFNAINEQVSNNVLKYLMNLAVNKESYTQVKAIASKTIDNLIEYLKKSSEVEASIKAHYLQLLMEFKKNPDKFHLHAAPKIPDGSPIGSSICNFNHSTFQ